MSNTDPTPQPAPREGGLTMAERYTPSYIAVKAPYVRSRGAEDMDGWRAGGAEFDRFLARVKRDAAREALDGLAAAEHRATRAEAQSEARQINAEYWRHRAIKCAARALGNDHPPSA